MAAQIAVPQRPLWARPAVVAAVVLGMAALKLWVAAHTDLVYDEAYYTLWSTGLSAGYLDHPPAVAWLIALGRAIAGNNEVGVRLMSILGDIAVAAAIYRTGRLLFDDRVGALAVLWHTLSIAAALGLVMTPDSPSILFWTLTLWAAAEFVASRNPWWWLLVGVFGGLGIESKLTNAFLAIGLLLFLLSSAERRRWLGAWQLWAGPVLAALVLAPLVIWNASHGWMTFWFQGRRTIGAERSPFGFASNFTEMVAGQALAIGPSLLLYAIFAGVLLVRGRAGSARHGLSLGLLTALPLVLYFVVHATHSRVELNWLLPIWPGLTLCGCWAALAFRPPGFVGWLAAGFRQSQLPYGVAAIALVFVQALYWPLPSAEFDRTKDFHGFHDLYAEVETLARDNGARWIVNPDNYGVTGELAAYALFAGSPFPVYQLTDRMRYLFRGPFRPDALGWPALYVNVVGNPATPVPPTHYFERAQLLSVLERKRGDEVLNYYEVFLVSDPTAAFEALADPSSPG